MPRQLILRLLCALTTLSLAAATSAAAQRVSLSPTIGVYIPTTELVKAANGDEFKQEVALAVGGASAWTSALASES